MVSSVLVKSYTSKNIPISNITSIAIVENTGRVEKLSSPPPGDAIPVLHFAPAEARRILLTWLPEQHDLLLVEKAVERTVAEVS